MVEPSTTRRDFSNIFCQTTRFMIASLIAVLPNAVAPTSDGGSCPGCGSRAFFIIAIIQGANIRSDDPDRATDIVRAVSAHQRNQWRSQWAHTRFIAGDSGPSRLCKSNQVAGIKRVVSAMTFATSRLDRFPKETKRLFRKNDKIGEVVAEIERKHPLIKDHFFRGLGHDAQFIESQILIEVIKTLKTDGIVALPIHDAVMVPASRVDRSREVMLDVFNRLSGVEGLVTEQRG